MPEERKLVTVLFADVTGSTSLGEDLDPEDVRALMARYYDHARRVIADHGGTLEKFIGDAVMAVFGLPQAHGDDAERAVAAALALRQAVGDDPLLTGMLLRIGVNTGEIVTTGDLSSGDFLVTGDAVNVAARLQQHAQPGEVLVSRRTGDAVHSAFLLGEAREMEVKGKREPQTVHPVKGVREARQIERPPLVGRKRELAQLDLLKGWALEEHRPQLSSIVAPAGTGKTRLLEEFLAGLDPAEEWRVATGRCLPYGHSLTYWPLRGLLQDLVGVIDRGSVADAFLRGGLSAEDADRLADAVLATLGIEIESETLERESIFNAWRLLVETLAREAPRVVIFEDLHWASDSLLDLVEHIMHPRTQAPLLIVAISRPELLDRRPAWGGGGKENVNVLVLKPLNEAQTEQLVERLGSELPDAIRRRIVERSGGNPFFATELVRGLAERGMGGEQSGADVMPDTVHAAVLARLDALSPTERAVAQAASVAGRAFRPATLAAMSDGMKPSEIVHAIDGLMARDLVVPADGDACAFRHVLIRDVAYGTLSRAERIRMHSAVAGWLEEFAAGRLEEFVELIAYHYREAVLLSQRSAAPLPLPFEPARAVSFLEWAAELAGRSGAFIETFNHIQSAISMAPPAEHARLYEKLGDVGPKGASADAYQEALQRWRAGAMDDPLIGARLLRKLSISLHRWGGRASTSVTDEEIAGMTTEAKALAQHVGDADELWRIRVAEVFEYYWHLRRRLDIEIEEAKERRAVALEAAAYFERQGAWEACSEALDAASAVSMETGEYATAVEAATRRLNLPQLPAYERADAEGMVLWSSFSLGQFEQCMSMAQELVAQHRVGEPVAHLATGLGWITASALLTGRWLEVDEIRPLLTDALDQLGVRSSTLVMAYIDLLVIALAREDRAGIDAAEAVIRRHPDNDKFEVIRNLLTAHLEDDPARLSFEGIEEVVIWWVHTALLFCNEYGVHVPDPFLEYLRALRSAPGTPGFFSPSIDMAEAIASDDPIRLAEAIEDAERRQLIPHAARVRIVLAEITGDPSPLAQARPILERLQDRQFLRRLEEVAARIPTTATEQTTA